MFESFATLKSCILCNFLTVLSFFVVSFKSVSEKIRFFESIQHFNKIYFLEVVS